MSNEREEITIRLGKNPMGWLKEMVFKENSSMYGGNYSYSTFIEMLIVKEYEDFRQGYMYHKFK